MIQSLVRALDLLEALKGPQKAYSIAELSSTLDLPPSTVHRILKTLCEKMFVVRDESAHTYKLGPALISIGMTASDNLNIRETASPVLEELARRTSEDSFFVVAAGYKGVVVEKADGINNLKVVENYGREFDLHYGAIRKVLLAYQPKVFIDTYIENLRRNRDSYPKTDPDKLVAELMDIRKQGVAISHGDYIHGAVGIGAPVFSAKGELKGSIGIIAPESRFMKEENIDYCMKLVKEHAEKLSYLMGYSVEY